MRQLKNYRAGGEADAKSQAEGLAAKYAGKSQSELMQELLKNVARAKGNGSFDPAQLREFVAFVSPSLDDAARERLSELVSMIDGDGSE